MPCSTSLRWRLRDATADAHACLDACVGNAFADAGAYAAFLRGMQRFVAAAARATGDDAARDGEAALAQDLADLDGAPLPAAAAARVDASSATGWRYVLAGSSLGARVLLPRAGALGFDASFGARYLAAQAGGDRWRAFLAGLDAAPVEAESALAGARAAFACAQDAMDAAFAAVPA